MQEARGDLWDFYTQGAWVCITTNGIVKQDGTLVMGAGCAREASERFPALSYNWGQGVLENGNRLQVSMLHRLISFPVKHHWREYADLDLIRHSAEQLMEWLRHTETFDADGQRRPCAPICLPRPGCGQGGLSWHRVKPVLADVLDDRITVVTW